MQIEKFALKATIEKNYDMVYFSQLDLVSILIRALKRAELPLYYTQGFRPHVKLSFGKALKVGAAGLEEVTFYFTQKTLPRELCEKLSPQMPRGLTIVEIK